MWTYKCKFYLVFGLGHFGFVSSCYLFFKYVFWKDYLIAGFPNYIYALAKKKVNQRGEDIYNGKWTR